MRRALAIALALSLLVVVGDVGAKSWKKLLNKAAKVQQQALGTQRHLTLRDIEPKLAKTPLAHVQFSGVTYTEIGVSEFDDFFKRAAKLRGLVEFTRTMTTASTAQLKGFAMSRAAGGAMEENIDTFVSTSSADMTQAQADRAMTQMIGAKGQIDADKRRYFAKTAGALALASVALVKSVKNVDNLAAEGRKLLEKANKLQAHQIPIALQGTQEAIGNIQVAATEGVNAAREAAVLGMAFRSLSQ